MAQQALKKVETTERRARVNPEVPGSRRIRDARGDRYNLTGARSSEAPGARRGKLKGAHVARVAVPDPLDGEARVILRVNRSVDALEKERSEGRITVSEYETGRIVQAVLEQGTSARLGSGGWNPFTSRDQTQARDSRLVRALETAGQVRAMRDRIERAIGTVGARFLAQVLAEHMSFAEVAACRGKSGERATAQIAGHFRLLLTGIDEAFAAEGAPAKIRGERAAPSDEVTDVNGVVVPEGQGYRLADDPAARWQPRHKSRAAQEALRRTGARR